MNRALAKAGGIFLCGLISLWMTAAWGTELYVPPLKVVSGQVVELPLMIDQVDNLAGVKVVIRYDPELLTFKRGTKTQHTDSLMHIINDKKPGLLIVVMAGARGIQGKDFPILRLTFATKEGLKENHTTRLNITEIQLMSDQLKDVVCRARVDGLTILPEAKKEAGK